ncbi:MAG: hypothetical protein P4L51_21370 [Puia sp.]|nr:hypothetical protein [Puia sp.]
MRDAIPHTDQDAGVKTDNSEKNTEKTALFGSIGSGKWAASPGQQNDKVSDGPVSRLTDDPIGQYGYEEEMKGKTGDIGGLFGM